MRALVEELGALDREELRLKRWRDRNRARDGDATRHTEATASTVCERCGRQSCGAAKYNVISDVLAMRVGLRCAVEAWVLREAFPTAVGRIRIDVLR